MKFVIVLLFAVVVMISAEEANQTENPLNDDLSGAEMVQPLSDEPQQQADDPAYDYFDGVIEDEVVDKQQTENPQSLAAPQSPSA